MKSEFTPEKWAHLHQLVAMTAHLNKKGIIHDATRNSKHEFRNDAKESAKYTPTRNPKQEFRNVAQNTAARNPKQEFRNVATVFPATEHTGKYVEKDNKTLSTKNESKRMSVAMFHGVDIKSETRDNKRVTSKENKDQEALNSKNDEKEMLTSIKIKGEVKEPE